MKVPTDIFLINKISTAFYFFDFCLQWRPKFIVKVVLRNNQGFMILRVNSGIKLDGIASGNFIVIYHHIYVCRV